MGFITQLLARFTTTENILIMLNWNFVKTELFEYRINPEPFYLHYSCEYESTRMLGQMLFSTEMVEYGLACFALGVFLKS